MQKGVFKNKFIAGATKQFYFVISAAKVRL